MATHPPQATGSARGAEARLSGNDLEAPGASVPIAKPPRQPRLRLLTAEHLAERSRRRRARAVGMLAAAVLIVTLLAVAGAQAIVAAQQLRLDGLQQQLATAVSTNQGLQLSHAELSSPERVLQMAENRLGMVVPATVTYLSAVPPTSQPPQGAPASRQAAGDRSGRDGAAQARTTHDGSAQASTTQSGSAPDRTSAAQALPDRGSEGGAGPSADDAAGTAGR